MTHRHLVDLGLAGPTAPILHWSSLVREPATHLPVPPSVHLQPCRQSFLLCPATSWAFEASPAMTLADWEAYRHRCTSTVYLSPSSDEARLEKFVMRCLRFRILRHLLEPLFWISSMGRLPQVALQVLNPLIPSCVSHVKKCRALIVIQVRAPQRRRTARTAVAVRNCGNLTQAGLCCRWLTLRPGPERGY